MVLGPTTVALTPKAEVICRTTEDMRRRPNRYSCSGHEVEKLQANIPWTFSPETGEQHRASTAKPSNLVADEGTMQYESYQILLVFFTAAVRPSYEMPRRFCIKQELRDVLQSLLFPE